MIDTKLVCSSRRLTCAGAKKKTRPTIDNSVAAHQQCAYNTHQD